MRPPPPKNAPDVTVTFEMHEQQRIRRMEELMKASQRSKQAETKAEKPKRKFSPKKNVTVQDADIAVGNKYEGKVVRHPSFTRLLYHPNRAASGCERGKCDRGARGGSAASGVPSPKSDLAQQQVRLGPTPSPTWADSKSDLGDASSRTWASAQVRLASRSSRLQVGLEL